MQLIQLHLQAIYFTMNDLEIGTFLGGGTAQLVELKSRLE